MVYKTSVKNKEDLGVIIIVTCKDMHTTSAYFSVLFKANFFPNKCYCPSYNLWGLAWDMRRRITCENGALEVNDETVIYKDTIRV